MRTCVLCGRVAEGKPALKWEMLVCEKCEGAFDVEEWQRLNLATHAPEVTWKKATA